MSECLKVNKALYAQCSAQFASSAKLYSMIMNPTRLMLRIPGKFL